ncbi:hypothetical protein VD0002_g7985 [Verticillium dahliae]|uniref:Uncharacterized protein n=1 Tax=Verticillium dahliae TaxID=27337 RepID=A0A2J8BQN8_VERDA|nr:Cytochrome b2 [Verticillium dahliae VDG2]KAF3353819.1 GTP-binding protein GUF1 [Verticillium dahliae VDG1]KAH6689262.1 hypothetical protein EV126DRAFT_431290 [Verticillium dahliae]PNH27078.1 hypothetical protein BJF96_g9577 [Verticillium dahliae]PNH38856.1 hypothetical protein VD0004_g7992 [Verticillium dahliae]
MDQPPSPPPLDRSALPEGQCRYILLVPGIKGQRCACAHFSHNQSTPGATCDCGHMACYHVKTAEQPAEKRELDLLKQRLEVVERQLDREQQGAFGSLVSRLGELEDRLDKTHDEATQEIRTSYRNINRVWQSVELLEQRCLQLHEAMRTESTRVTKIDHQMRSVADRQLELADADLSLEERLDSLETHHVPVSPTSRASTPQLSHAAQSSVPAEAKKPTPPPISVDRTPAAKGTSGPWTVHISLLPSSSQPFPFERDTNAYKRCLSRGLHRTVVVADADSHSFCAAVSTAFDAVLKGRPWMPLKAKLCDATQLRGLPMLRPLGKKLADAQYDLDFLREHCAVSDSSGNVESLYIAMRHDTLSWHFLRRSPRFLDGLETCWSFDPYLDPDDAQEDDDLTCDSRPSAGHIMPQLSSLKRRASDATQTSVFGSASVGGEGENARKKMTIVSLSTIIDLPRRVEKV